MSITVFKKNNYQEKPLIQEYPILELFPETLQNDLYQYLPRSSKGFKQFKIKKDKSLTLTNYTKNNLGLTPRQVRTLGIKISKHLQTNPLIKPLDKDLQDYFKSLNVFFDCLEYAIYFISLNSEFKILWLDALPKIVTDSVFIDKNISTSINKSTSDDFINKAKSYSEMFFFHPAVINVNSWNSLFSPLKSFEQKLKIIESHNNYPDVHLLIKDTVNSLSIMENDRRLRPLFEDRLNNTPFNERNNIKSYHDVVAKIAQDLTTQVFPLKLESNFSGIQCLTQIKFNDDSLKVVIPQTNRDLLNWGQTLRICVGTYAERVAKGKTIVVGVTSNDQIKYCIELSPKGSSSSYFNYGVFGFGFRIQDEAWRLFNGRGNHEWDNSNHDSDSSYKYSIYQFKGLGNINASVELQKEFSGSIQFLGFNLGNKYLTPRSCEDLAVDNIKVVENLRDFQKSLKSRPLLWNHPSLKQFQELINLSAYIPPNYGYGLFDNLLLLTKIKAALTTVSKISPYTPSRPYCTSALAYDALKKDFVVKEEPEYLDLFLGDIFHGDTMTITRDTNGVKSSVTFKGSNYTPSKNKFVDTEKYEKPKSKSLYF